MVNDDRLQPFDQQPITTIRVIVGFDKPFELEEHWSQGHLSISLREGGVYRCRPRPRATGDREEARGSLKTGTTELPVRQ